ncbi:DUF2314 domain-containing protein [Diaphorobacter caeni]|uniref:DUF2314 domain-containing protein n=1 Tax=Diaphorobacter caeni TaxID=2784387 RepID=UPI00188EC816|nr:DUF2314 domain-containing protein [Diaphorobacter caeni]MBF5007545.1 DUF2314 domain-containing protein [Diaphorobacter caeni]
MTVERQDPAMRQAIQRAQQSFPFFWRELSWEYRRIIPGLEFAAIKLPFAVSAEAQATQGAPAVEHMWVGDVQFDGHMLSGSLLNDANFIPELQSGADVSAPLADLEDWMYTSTGVLCGGFTVQAIRAAMSPAERAEHDAAWGQPFPDPALCNITPYEVPAPKPPSGLSRLWKKAAAPGGLPFDEALKQVREKEHPMSENMRERYASDLEQQPDMVNAVLDDGWTLLQRDALAGNLAPVQVLRQLGADAHNQRTPQGDSALDLAQRMGWTRVVEALR